MLLLRGSLIIKLDNFCFRFVFSILIKDNFCLMSLYILCMMYFKLDIYILWQIE